MSPDVPPELAGFTWAAPHNFLGLEPEYSSWARSAAVVLPIPYEATTSYGAGTRAGPEAILQASRNVELYDEELDTEPHTRGIYTLPPIELSGAGPEQAVAQLRELYDKLLVVAEGRFVVGLGGEHSISSAPAGAWLRRLKGDLSVLQFDAHADMREAYRETSWSHAAVMHRVLDHTDRIVAVGIRSLTADERVLTRKRGITTIFAHELRDEGWVVRALQALGPNVYITFDVDFFDPSVIPATGTPEPGGATWWQALDLLRAVFKERNVVGADVVELAPRPGDIASDLTVAKLVYKLIGYRIGL